MLFRVSFFFPQSGSEKVCFAPLWKSFGRSAVGVEVENVDGAVTSHPDREGPI